jgi:hypothetical protein
MSQSIRKPMSGKVASNQALMNARWTLLAQCIDKNFILLYVFMIKILPDNSTNKDFEHADDVSHEHESLVLLYHCGRVNIR